MKPERLMVSDWLLKESEGLLSAYPTMIKEDALLVSTNAWLKARGESDDSDLHDQLLGREPISDELLEYLHELAWWEAKNGWQRKGWERKPRRQSQLLEKWFRWAGLGAESSIGTSTIGTSITDSDKNRIWAAFQGLKNGDQREVVLMRIGLGWTYVRISQELGISPSTPRVRFKAACRRMRINLKDDRNSDDKRKR